MDHLSGSASAVLSLTLLAIVLAIVLIVGWIVLPFAVIGMKPLVRELIKEQQATNRLIEAQTRAMAARSVPGVPLPVPTSSDSG